VKFHVFYIETKIAILTMEFLLKIPAFFAIVAMDYIIRKYELTLLAYMTMINIFFLTFKAYSAFITMKILLF